MFATVDSLPAESVTFAVQVWFPLVHLVESNGKNTFLAFLQVVPQPLESNCRPPP